MRIQTRALFIIGVMLLALILLLTLIAQNVVLSSYASVESQESATNVRLVSGLLQNDIETLGESIHVWAVSDATYQYMADNNSAYLQSQIEVPSFHENLDVDGVLFYDANGSLVSSAWFGAAGTPGSGLSRDTVATIAVTPGLLPDASGVFSSGVKRQQGLIMLPEGPAIIAMHTILPGNAGGEATSRGTFVVVRSLDAGRIADLQDRARLPIRITPLTSPGDNGTPAIAPVPNGGTLPVAIRVENESIITGSTYLTDIRNQPILHMEVQTPRHLHQQALASLSFILLSFLLISVFCAILTGMLLDRYIITHLIDLDARLKDIGKRRDLSSRIPEQGDDEIISLKRSLNQMLQELETSQAALAEANRRANLYLDIYLDVLSYEIQNSTIALRSYADFIADNGGEENLLYVSRIIDIIDRDREVIRNIETISSIYKTPPARLPVDLGQLISRVAATFPDTRIRCEGCAVTVIADDNLEIVFLNIIRNSIKYGGPDVEITISVRDAGTDQLELSVTDTGKGISDLMKPLIFDRFLKDSDRRSSYGLGLHIVKMLIEAYGGKVWADDRVPGQPGLGAAIRFTLKKP